MVCRAAIAVLLLASMAGPGCLARSDTRPCDGNCRGARAGITTDGLHLYLSLDCPTVSWEADGMVYDQSGYANDGRTIGMGRSSVRPGASCEALQFDGRTTGIAIADSPDFRLAELYRSFTVTLWARPAEHQNANTDLVGNATLISTTRGWKIMASNSSRTFHLSVNDGLGGQTATAASRDFTLPAEQWSMVTAVVDRDAGQIRQYVDDGTVVSTASIAALGSFEAGWGLGIGMIRSNTGRTFAGDIDEVRVYDRALPTAEVAALHYATAP